MSMWVLGPVKPEQMLTSAHVFGLPRYRRAVKTAKQEQEILMRRFYIARVIVFTEKVTGRGVKNGRAHCVVMWKRTSQVTGERRDGEQKDTGQTAEPPLFHPQTEMQGDSGAESAALCASTGPRSPFQHPPITVKLEKESRGLVRERWRLREAVCGAAISSRSVGRACDL
ncbi:Uncharacterized protein DAT39_021411 [Clarias magur]|uniref:Uncharacterized protein n=1 Tax=Clarias magur TaxID=1594786 RepID=A0A8J4X8Z0_CLAMG|nr:Uncharacterized protein DAT39_021411 [Clarias magur]